jgi:hypothetical protein
MINVNHDGFYICVPFSIVPGSKAAAQQNHILQCGIRLNRVSQHLICCVVPRKKAFGVSHVDQVPAGCMSLLTDYDRGGCVSYKVDARWLKVSFPWELEDVIILNIRLGTAARLHVQC